MDSKPTTDNLPGDVFLVLPDDNPARLAAGTSLTELRRFEEWDYPGCNVACRTLVLDLRVLDGPHTGEVIEVGRERYEYDPRWPLAEPTWLARVAETAGRAVGPNR